MPVFLRIRRTSIGYRGLLKTKLTEFEPEYIQRRLSEEQFEAGMLFKSPSFTPIVSVAQK